MIETGAAATMGNALARARAHAGRWPRRGAMVTGLVLALGACQSYQPSPLADRPDLAETVPHLTLPADGLRLLGAGSYRFPAGGGLDMTGAAIVAVLNNPGLKAARLKSGDARAQLFAAGLLPDPQLDLSGDHVTTGPGVTSAFGVGLSVVLDSLITRGARLDSARAEARSVDLDLLWQEWQVAQQARLAFVRVRTLERQAELLRRTRDLYDGLDRQSRQALAQGNITLDIAGTNLVALVDTGSRLDAVERDLDKARHDLNALLGLAPSVTVSLAGGGEPAAATAAEIRDAVRRLPERRPDLLALKAGYDSQEAKVRQAILAQFPSLTISARRARDTSEVYTDGLGLTLSLPIFTGARGTIAIERATRARLRAEYLSRLDAAVGEVDQVRAGLALATAQLARVEGEIRRLEEMVAPARRAYASRDLPAATYLALEQSLLGARLDATGLRQTRLDAEIMLETVLGEPIRDGGKDGGT